MTLNEFTKHWDELLTFDEISNHRRIDKNHPLNMFFGFYSNDYREFILVTDIKPEIKLVSKSIDIEVGLRNDKKFALCFRLKDTRLTTVFIHLCWDLFEYTWDCIDDVSGIKKIQNRFKIWQKMLEEGSDGLLSIQMIKGLIGELIFLKDYAIPRFGIDASISSWIGPQGAHKDFWFESIWYEIKTIDPSSKHIEISSLEQLQSDIDGKLVCIKLEKTSSTASNHVSLPQIIHEIRDLIDNEETRLQYEKKLLEVGYFERDEYRNYNFNYIGNVFYGVNQEFPKITRESVNDAITDAKYKISISNIKKWQVI